MSVEDNFYDQHVKDYREKRISFLRSSRLEGNSGFYEWPTAYLNLKSQVRGRTDFGADRPIADFKTVEESGAYAILANNGLFQEAAALHLRLIEQGRSW